MSDANSNKPDPPPYESDCCGSCRFWLGFDNKKDDPPDLDLITLGRCRRFPPVIDLGEIANAIAAGRMSDDEKYWDQPLVGDEGWCGEYKPEEDAR